MSDQTKTDRGRAGRIYRFGDAGRLKPYLDGVDDLPALTLGNLPGLTSADMIVSCRPRSTLLEALFLLRGPEKRPALINMSDGFIFRQNAFKRGNLRYGWLNKHIFADQLVVRQPLASLDNVCEEIQSVTSLVEYDTTSTQTTIDTPVFVFLAGNDPYLDLPHDTCLNAFVSTMQAVRDHFEAGAEIVLSCPNAKLRTAIEAKVDGVQVIGRMIDADLNEDSCIFVGSPSTVLHDRFLQSRPCYILPPYQDSGFERFCAPSEAITQANPKGGAWSFSHLGPKDLTRRDKLTPNDLWALATPRRDTPIKALQFFKEFQPLVCGNELKILLTKDKKAGG